MLRFSNRLTLLLHSLYSISYVYPTNLHQSSILHSNRQWPALSSQSIQKDPKHESNSYIHTFIRDEIDSIIRSFSFACFTNDGLFLIDIVHLYISKHTICFIRTPASARYTLLALKSDITLDHAFNTGSVYYNKNTTSKTTERNNVLEVSRFFSNDSKQELTVKQSLSIANQQEYHSQPSGVKGHDSLFSFPIRMDSITSFSIWDRLLLLLCKTTLFNNLPVLLDLISTLTPFYTILCTITAYQ